MRIEKPFLDKCAYLSSPAIINGIFWLNAIRVSLTFFRGTTCCTQIGLYLFTLISKTKTLPSDVTAARTVLEYGAHFTSPTLAPKSNMNSGSLEDHHFQLAKIKGRRWRSQKLTCAYPPRFSRANRHRTKQRHSNWIYWNRCDKRANNVHDRSSDSVNWILYCICRWGPLRCQPEICPVASDGRSCMCRRLIKNPLN